MRDLQKRITRLEQFGPQGKVHIVVVAAGQDPSAAEQTYLLEHPEAKQGRLITYLTNIPEPDPLPAAFA